MLNIKDTVERLCKKCGTRDPFEIAKQLHITVLYEALGDIRGYCSLVLQQQFIHINQDLDPLQQRFTCCHELGHAILHPGINTPFLRGKTQFSVNKFEVEANRFAILLLCNDETAQEMIDKNFPIADIPSPWRELMQWRLEQARFSPQRQ